MTARIRSITGTLWILALVAVWLPQPAAAELQVDIEPRVIDELDTARLTIRATGTNLARRLDLEALEEDFEVLTTQSSSQYRSINGKVESWVEYQVLLRPRRAGEITIPSIQLGGESTAPVTVQVRGLDPELQQAIDRMVFFETELTRNPVYVQAQTVLVRRLHYASGAQIYSDLPGTPEIPEAVVIPLGETTSSTAIIDGQRYGVIEQRFAIFPEQSGELQIPAISVTSSVRVQSGGRTRRSGVRIATEPLTLEVLPIPSEYPADQPWLPAESLSLSDQWTPVDARIGVGDPLNRTLSARVDGNVSSVIPPLQPELPDRHFRRYPEPPELRDDAKPDTVRGLRAQRYSVIPTAPGTVTVPATEVVWWDVTARQVRVASTPGRTFWISGTALQQPEPATGAPAEATAEAAETTADAADLEPAPDSPPPAEIDVRSEQVPWPGPDRRRVLWLVLLGALVAAALIRWWPRRPQPEHDAPPSRRAAWRTLQHACRQNDAGAIHDALTRYLSAHYGVSAAEAARCFRRDGHGPMLDRVNARLYGSGHRPGDDGAVTGEQVLADVAVLRRRRARRAPDPLPALYD